MTPRPEVGLPSRGPRPEARRPTLAFSATLLLCATAAVAQTGWVERRGMDLFAPSAGAEAREIVVLPHHDLLVEVASKDRATAAIRLTSASDGGTTVVVGPEAETPDELSDGRLRFGVPVVPSGRYELALTTGASVRSLGTIRIPPARCYFNRAGDPRQASSLEAITPHVVLHEVMARYMDRARRTLEVAMSDFDHPQYVDAIVRARKRGVKVRVVTDERELKDAAFARERLTKEGVPWIANGRALDSLRTMHHKYLVVDGLATLIGHAKGDRHHARCNQCFVGVLGASVAAAYVAEFDAMWGASEGASPPEGRRFAMDKPTPRLVACKIPGPAGPIAVEIVFSPDPKPDNTGDKRPINRYLRGLVDAATSDVCYIASGFGDVDVGDALRDARDKRGVAVMGVQGEPDWFTDRNSMVDAMRGIGSKAWRPPADVVMCRDVLEDGSLCNAHNRSAVVDVLDASKTPVACFSSGAWRGGRQEADDSMLCIRDREVAEQFLQHFGGTRLRALRPLPHRNVLPRTTLEDGVIRAELLPLLRLFGGEVVRGVDGRRIVRIGDFAVSTGRPDDHAVGVALVDASEIEGDAPFAGLKTLAALGLAVRKNASGGFSVVSGLGVDVPLEAPKSGGAPRAPRLLAEGERPGPGFASWPVDEGAAAASRTTAPIARPPVLYGARAPLTTDRGLVVLAPNGPGFRSAAPERQILLTPQAALAFADAMRSFVAAHPKAGELVVSAPSARSWRPKAGWGLSIVTATKDEDLARDLLERLAAEGFLTIRLDQSLLGPKKDLFAYLNRGRAKDWKPYGRSDGATSETLHTVVYPCSIDDGALEVEFSEWLYRNQ